MRAAGRNGGKWPSGKIIATIKIQCENIKLKQDAAVHALHAHVGLRCWIIQSTGAGWAYFFYLFLFFARMPGPLMANGCVHWYIYLGNTHSPSLPHSSHLAISLFLSAGFLSVNVLHSSFIFSTYSLQSVLRLRSLHSLLCFCASTKCGNNAKRTVYDRALWPIM